MALRLGALDKAIGAQEADDVVGLCRTDLLRTADFAQPGHEPRQERMAQVHGCEGQFMRDFVSEAMPAVPIADDVGGSPSADDEQGRALRPLSQHRANDSGQFGQVEQAPPDFVDCQMHG